MILNNNIDDHFLIEKYDKPSFNLFCLNTLTNLERLQLYDLDLNVSYSILLEQFHQIFLTNFILFNPCCM